MERREERREGRERVGEREIVDHSILDGRNHKECLDQPPNFTNEETKTQERQTDCLKVIKFNYQSS